MKLKLKNDLIADIGLILIGSIGFLIGMVYHINTQLFFIEIVSLILIAICGLMMKIGFGLTILNLIINFKKVD